MVETETRGSRNTDKYQSTDQSPSAANLVLNTLGPPPLLACDCFLGWHLAKSVHTNTLFDLLVSLTRAVFPQSVKNVLPTTWEKVFVKAVEPSVIFFIKIFWSFLLSKSKDYKTEMNLIKMDIFLCFAEYLKIAETWQRAGHERELFHPTATLFDGGSTALSQNAVHQHVWANTWKKLLQW